MPKKSPSAPATEATPKPRKPVAAKAAPTHDEVALRAYHIYLKRSGSGAAGSPFDDWKQAEQELLAETNKPKSRRKSKIVPFAA